MITRLIVTEPHRCASIPPLACPGPPRGAVDNSTPPPALPTVSIFKTSGVQVVPATVNGPTGRQNATARERADLLTDDKPRARTTINSWEDIDFVETVHATGRRKLIICALWTEMCMAFAALDALREGYEVYPVVDAIGGTSPDARRACLHRGIQARGQPVT